MINEVSKVDAFKREWPRIDWELQLRYGAGIGLGSLEYELMEK
jgi:uncharacterized Fe-S center protein